MSNMGSWKLKMKFGVLKSKNGGGYVVLSPVVEASFYGDTVVFVSDAEGRVSDPQPGQMVYRIFHMSVTFILTGDLRQKVMNSQRTRLTYREIICHKSTSTVINDIFFFVSETAVVLGIQHTCTDLRYKPAFIVTW